jgi:hypothetical protein
LRKLTRGECESSAGSDFLRPIASDDDRTGTGPAQHCQDTEQPELDATAPLSQRSFIGEAPLDGFKQGYRLERLSEKALGAARARFLVQMPVGKARHQDYGYCSTLFAEPSYEVGSAHSEHCNVGDNAIEQRHFG